MIVSFIECYHNITVRAEMFEHKTNKITDFFICSYYVDNKLIDTLQTFDIQKCISDIQKDFNKIFLDRHKEYIEKIPVKELIERKKENLKTRK